ncbi:MAG: hypothetical protein PSX80_11645 [bacterium]|nr:hypothetical protein [bacterium]
MRSLAKVSLLLILCTAAFADVAPDFGYTYVPADLTLRSVGDLSGYRFFLESPNRIEEIKITPGATTTISASGRSGVAKIATLIAVPTENFGHISGDLSGPLLENFIRDKRFPDARELLIHYFQTTIPTIEKPVWTPPLYYVSVENGVITAQKPIDGVDTSVLARLLLFGVVGGVLMTIGIAIIGLWLFRRSRKKV